MKGRNLFAFTSFLIFILINTQIFAAAPQNNTPVGYWQTVDDQSGEVLSIVQIYPAEDQSLQGKIVKIMPVLGQKPSDLCTKCKGDLQNKPMLGLIVIHDMKQLNENSWGKGHVLDPKTGDLYKATLTVMNNGDNLKLRGYIGLSALGRTEFWKRIAKP